MSRIAEIVKDLDAQRDSFLEALDAVDPELLTAPGLVESWSARDLVVHVAFWCEHGTSALALATAGRGDEFAYDQRDTDRMNAELAAETPAVAPDAAREREELAFSVFRAAIQALEPGLLDQRLGNGDTVAEVIAYDGAEHYEEHAAHLRAWFDPQEDQDAAAFDSSRGPNTESAK